MEADDLPTRHAAEALAQGGRIEVVVVPAAHPRTKPKALVYALPFARGDLVVVYDAEDRPEPDQLRKAAALFAADPRLGCLQARLSPDNSESWLARIFGLEYATNFEVVLPGLARLGVPLPLGGTSNHFRRRLLQRVGAWDPFNVTEDADLGVRLARFGCRSRTFASRTYEEAPVTLRQWLPQRRRWLKGWMQTALVAGPRLARFRPLRPLDWVAVHGVITGGVVGVLLFPASLVALGLAVAAYAAGRGPEGPLEHALVALNLFNAFALLAGVAIAAGRAALACRDPRLLARSPALVAYWLVMSVAAWQALFQLARDGSLWEKTSHGVSQARRTPAFSPPPEPPSPPPSCRR